MEWYKRVKSFFVPETDATEAEPGTSAATEAAGGFARKVAVPAPRPAPVISNPGYGASGGIQGLDWYKARMRVDSDGDIAEEFLEEPCSAAQPGSSRAQAAKQQALREQTGSLPAAQEALVFIDAGNVFVVPADR